MHQNMGNQRAETRFYIIWGPWSSESDSRMAEKASNRSSQNQGSRWSPGKRYPVYWSAHSTGVREIYGTQLCTVSQ